MWLTTVAVLTVLAAYTYYMGGVDDNGDVHLPGPLGTMQRCAASVAGLVTGLVVARIWRPRPYGR